MKQTNIKIPYKCLLPLVEKPDLLKAFVVYGKLKMMFTNGAVHNIRSRKKELAKRLDISENTFRKYLGILKSYFLASTDENDTLRLVGRYGLYDIFKMTPHFSVTKNRITDKWYKINKEDFDIEEIQFLALKHKRNNIDYKNIERIKNNVVKTFGNILCPKIKQKIESKARKTAKTIVDNSQENFAESFNPNSKYGFVDNNLSGQSIAKLLGKKSKITGNRFMHKLAKKNKIAYTPRTIALQELTCFTNIKIIQEENTLPCLIKKYNGVNTFFFRVLNAWILI